MKTLKLFNAVISKSINDDVKPRISEDGFIIMPGALWAKDEILKFYENERLNGNDLNKTFHKSWKKIKNSSRFELFMYQIIHYISTYGSDFKDEIYIPNEVLELPDVKLKFKVVHAYSKDEMTDKCLSLLKSGIALKEETINDVLTVLTDELDYTFTGKEGIRNKEAIIKIADLYNVLPADTMEFFRFIIYKATGQSLLIKNPMMVSMIKNSNFNPTVLFKQHGLDKLSEIFNRFKPLFLAFKKQCPKTINKISKLSKVNHKPMVTNILNEVTSKLITKDNIHWLDNATPYALFKAMFACHCRVNGQDTFLYRIRNGKSWVMENESGSIDVAKNNYTKILLYLLTKYSFSGKKFYFPKDVKYALPTSEKMFVGNIPMGTIFTGKKLAVGVYWENAWGANDLDISGLNVNGKVGWNSQYNQKDGQLMYSGDITSAPNGAVEYLYANKGLDTPTLVQNNVYYGDENSEYKIIIGRGDKISKDYMMNPDNLFAETKCKMAQRQTTLGIFLPNNEKNEQKFVMLNTGFGNLNVSHVTGQAKLTLEAIIQQWSKPISFKKIVKLLGGEIVGKPEDADYDYSLDSLDKDSFTKLFEKQNKK